MKQFIDLWVRLLFGSIFFKVENGSDYFLALGGNRVLRTTSHSSSRTYDEIETTTKDSAGSKEFMAGEDSETMTVECKLDEGAAVSYQDIRTLGDAKAVVAVVSGTGVGTAGGEIITGSCIINNIDQTAPQNDSQVYTIALRMTGLPTFGTSAATIS